MAKSGAGIPSGILSDSKFLYGNQIQLPGILGMGQEFIKNMMHIKANCSVSQKCIINSFIVNGTMEHGSIKKKRESLNLMRF